MQITQLMFRENPRYPYPFRIVKDGENTFSTEELVSIREWVLGTLSGSAAGYTFMGNAIYARNREDAMAFFIKWGHLG